MLCLTERLLFKTPFSGGRCSLWDTRRQADQAECSRGGKATVQWWVPPISSTFINIILTLLNNQLFLNFKYNNVITVICLLKYIFIFTNSKMSKFLICSTFIFNGFYNIFFGPEYWKFICLSDLSTCCWLLFFIFLP